MNEVAMIDVGMRKQMILRVEINYDEAATTSSLPWMRRHVGIGMVHGHGGR